MTQGRYTSSPAAIADWEKRRNHPVFQWPELEVARHEILASRSASNVVATDLQRNQPYKEEDAPSRSACMIPASARKWCFVAIANAASSLTSFFFSSVSMAFVIADSFDLADVAGDRTTCIHINCMWLAALLAVESWLTRDRLRALEIRAVKSLRPLRDVSADAGRV